MTAFIGHLFRRARAGITALILGLTVTFAVSVEASARTDTLPPQFVGIWGRDLERGAECYAADFGNPATGERLHKIDPDGISSIGSRCRFRKIIRQAREPSIISVVLSCRGNRQLWKSSYTWRLADLNGQASLVTAGSSRHIEIYRRCR